MSDEAVISYSEDIVVKVRHNQEVYVELASQGPQGPQGERGAQGDVTPEVQTLRDEAVAAASTATTALGEIEDLAEEARLDAASALASKNAAGTSAGNAATSAVNAADSVVEAQAHAQNALTAGAASVAAKEEAQAAQVGAETALASTLAARDVTDTARNEAVQARADAIAARDLAQGAAVTAGDAVSDAEAHRDAAEGFAQAAAQSAADAALFDPSSYPTKANNGSDFDDPAQVRINIGAATALEDITRAEAEAGVATIARNWNAERVRQAIAAYAAPSSHAHTIADITNLQTSLDAKAALDSPEFSGVATVPTASLGDVSLQIANTEFVKNAFDAFIGSAPGTLDTIYEIAEALGNDPNAFTTLTNQIAGKADLAHTHVVGDITGLQAALDAKASLASPAFTGNPTAVTQAANDNSTRLATTAHVKAAIAASGLSTEGHSHEIADITDLQAALDGKAAVSHTHVMADITDLATALAAKAPLASPALTGNPTATTQAAGDNSTRIATTAFVTTAVANGISGKADASHAHAIADITGLQTALDGKAASSHSHAISGITGLSDALAAKADAETVTTQLGARYTKNEIDLILADYYTSEEVDTALAGKAASSHSHAIADITGLQTALESKASASHAHAIADITGLQNALDAKAASSHSHAIANVTGLQGALDAKFPTAGGTMSGSLSVTGDITASGNITAYSDARLKSDVETISDALDLVCSMRGVRFTMNDERSIGVIAQELRQIAPELVREGADGDHLLSVAYGNITGILIEAIKELRDEVAELRKAA